MASATYSKDSYASHGGSPFPVDKHFRAMSTEVFVSIITDDALSAQQESAHIERAIAIFEKNFSRFLPESELTKLNRSGGRSFRASTDMVHILAEAKRWHGETRGIFDPTIIGALEALGYEKSIDFARGPVTIAISTDIAAHQNQFSMRRRFPELTINATENIVHAPEGLRVDLGGIGKGYIVDAAVGHASKTFKDFWISAGGDISLSGTNFGKPWEVKVQNPLALEDDIGHITIPRGERAALATSGITKRKGIEGGFAWHHLIDPLTGLPANNGIIAVTVLAPTATAADILAKTVLIAGKEKGLEFIARHEDAGCIIVDAEGTIMVSDRMKEYFTPYA